MPSINLDGCLERARKCQVLEEEEMKALCDLVIRIYHVIQCRIGALLFDGGVERAKCIRSSNDLRRYSRTVF
jgi:hypothetical protein